MPVPSEYPSRLRRLRLSRSVTPAITLALSFGLTGVYVNLPPLPPPGMNPRGSSRWKKCPGCGKPVRPARDGLCVCKNCYEEFDSADAQDYK